MPERRRRLLPLALLAALGAGPLAGCAGLPSAGPVHVGAAVPAESVVGDVDIRVLPPAPLPGMSATEVVRGFLRALVNDDGDYEIARTYLTRRAAATWSAGTRVTTYDDASVQLDQSGAGRTRQIRLQVSSVGSIDSHGEFTAQARRIGSTFRLARENGQWRIDRLPKGVLVSALDAQRLFRAADLYFVTPAGNLVVPDLVLLRAQSRALPTVLVHALLAGPGAHLRGAVRTAFPPGTDLLGNVPVDADGVAEVNLSGPLRQAGPGQLRAATSQLLWTLRQVPGITQVRLLVDGAPVPGARGGGALATADAPRGAVAATGPYYRTGAGWRAVHPPGRASALHDAAGLTDVAVSLDGASYAGLARTRHGMRLVAAAVDGTRLGSARADAFTPPAPSPAGMWTVATRAGEQQVLVVGSGGVRRVAAALPPGVRRLVPSPDGTRVAVLAGRELAVGAVVQRGNRLSLVALHDVLPQAVDVRDVSWAGADRLATIARLPGAPTEVVLCDGDGYLLRPVPGTARLDPVAVAGAPGRPLVVSDGADVWIATASGRWRHVGAGSTPRYPG